MRATVPPGQLWDQWLTQLATIWEGFGFKLAETAGGAGFVRLLDETTQLVQYEVGSLSPEQATFTIQLGVWSHRLTRLQERSAGKLNARHGHWHTNLVNLMAATSGHLWWTVSFESLPSDLNFHAQLVQTTILPILHRLASDHDLVEAWRSGDRRSGLTPLANRAAYAVELAHEVDGSDEAAAVARDMAALSARAGRDRPAAIAKLRQVIRSLNIDGQFFEDPPETEMN